MTVIKITQKFFQGVLTVMSKSKVMVPEARAALDQFKMEAANEVGVNLKQGYNGDLTSKQAGSVGGQMVNMMIPEHQWKFNRTNRNKTGHKQNITFSMQAGI